MTTHSKTTTTILGSSAMAMLLTLVVGCGGTQVSIGEQDLDGSAGGTTGGVDAPPSGGSTSSSSMEPVGGTSQPGGASASAGQTGAAGILAGSTSKGGNATGGASPLGGSTPGGGSKAGGSATGGSKAGGSSGTAGSEYRCGGISGLKCPDGTYCDYGACVVITDAMGKCIAQPEICAANFDPVCGCDSKTYSNDCMRVRAGVGKLSDGACGGSGGTGGSTAVGGTGGTATGGTTGTNSSAQKTCSSDATCGTGAFCDFPVGGCGLKDAAGVCVNNPGGGGGITLWQPVCGCDGRTYGNDCERIRAGVSKKSEGECSNADGGASDAGSSATALCYATGGTVTTELCCQNTGDFPDSCVPGACGCAPADSHTVSSCNCPNGCFQPGVGCVGAPGTCTVGVEYSCNDNPNLASIYGRCLTDGRCVCSRESPLLPNGKCK